MESVYSRSMHFLGVLIMGLLLAGGCSDSTEETTKCTGDGDCAGGKKCFAGVCVECTKDADCGKGKRCELSGSAPVCVALPGKDGGPADGAASDARKGDQLVVCKKDQTRACYNGKDKTKGVGACKAGTESCSGGKWDGICTGEVLPTAETCNSKDDDCDGTIDEGGVCGNCTPGSTMTCYTGDTKTKGIGLCKSGTRTCLTGNTWSTCQGEITPTSETCNNKDDDCDGETDEKVTWDGSPCVDPTRKGICQAGTWTCNQGKMSCKQTATASTETCNNGKDDDCDGETDESPPCKCATGSTNACYNGPIATAGVGVCAKGVQICDSKQAWGPCLGEVKPDKETCNNKDDDCDGQLDEEFPQKGWQCLVAGKQGACAVGKFTACSKGSLLCTGPTATAEVCNGIDDDCDGYIDNVKQGSSAVLTKPCYDTARGGCTSSGSGYSCKGSCKAGLSYCAGGKWIGCSGASYPGLEQCSGKDENCNGLTDDIADLNKVCASPTRHGVCKPGIWACYGNTKICKQTVNTSAELCNGKDDDCDGYIDNATKGTASALSRACYQASKGCTAAGLSYSCVGACKAGKEVCVSGTWLPCAGYAYPSAEICNNNADDDCDGTKDNGCSGGSDGKKICIPFELRCAGYDVEICNSGGTAWQFREACLKGCSAGKCIGGGCVPFSLSTSPSTLRADAKSSCLVVSGKILSQNGTAVPDGTLFTIASNKGTVKAVDGDPNIPGVQVRSVNGRVDFSVTAPDLAKAEVSATATDTPKYVPDYDNNGITASVTITGLANKVLTLLVVLKVEHPRSDDLEIVLQSPQGTKVTLEVACNPTSGKCSATKDLNTVYPQQKKAEKGAIKDFYGQIGNGTWKLTLKDPYYGPKNSKGVVDPGKLISWSLMFNAAAVTAGTMNVTATHALSKSCKANLSVAYNATPMTRTVAEDFTSSTHNDTTLSTAHWDTGLGRIDPFPADFGTGRDGDLNVTSGTYNLNQHAQAGRLFPDAVSFTVTALGTNSATLKGGVGGLVIGDEVLLINMQGDSNYYSNVGSYEIKTIAKIDFASNKLFFATILSKYFGRGNSNSTLSGQKIMLQRIPHYRKVVVNGTLTADAWDGARGGVLFFKASQSVEVKGSVNMNYKGYRPYSAAAGESLSGGYQKTNGTSANLGGGGVSTTSWSFPNCNWSNSGCWSYKQWFFYAGGGGHGTVGTASTTTHHTTCSGQTNCYYAYPATAGKAYGDATLKQWHLGSAGGGGGYTRRRCCNTSNSTTYGPYKYGGGLGGGLIVIWTAGISITGGVYANGNNGSSYSGGGSGGTIFIRSRSMNVGNKRVTARGASYAGAGRIRLDFFGLSGTSDPVHYAGFSGKTVAVTKNLNFTGKTLLSAQVAKTIEDLRGGVVAYQLSPNGGKNWYTAAVGKDLMFTAGTDLRLKVLFTNKSLDPLSLMGALVNYKIK